MITRKFEQKIDELKKNIDQRFEAQSEMIKSNFKEIFKEELKKEIDERVNSEKHMLQQQIT